MSGTSAPCVLVVDDQELIREATQLTLETFGYRVITAASGSEALDLFAAHQEEIDVVLTDMRMPQMDGATLIKALLKMEPSVRVVATSGAGVFGRDLDILRKAKSGQLPKPFTAQMLVAAMREVLA